MTIMAAKDLAGPWPLLSFGGLSVPLAIHKINACSLPGSRLSSYQGSSGPLFLLAGSPCPFRQFRLAQLRQDSRRRPST